MEESGMREDYGGGSTKFTCAKARHGLRRERERPLVRSSCAFGKTVELYEGPESLYELRSPQLIPGQKGEAKGEANKTNMSHSLNSLKEVT